MRQPARPVLVSSPTFSYTRLMLSSFSVWSRFVKDPPRGRGGEGRRGNPFAKGRSESCHDNSLFHTSYIRQRRHEQGGWKKPGLFISYPWFDNRRDEDKEFRHHRRITAYELFVAGSEVPRAPPSPFYSCPIPLPSSSRHSKGHSIGKPGRWSEAAVLRGCVFLHTA